MTTQAAYFIVMLIAGAALAYVETRWTVIGGDSPAHYLWLLGASLAFDIANRALLKDKPEALLTMGQRVSGFIAGGLLYIALHDYVLPRLAA